MPVSKLELTPDQSSVEQHVRSRATPSRLGPPGRIAGLVRFAAGTVLCTGLLTAATSCTTEVVNRVAAPDEAHGLVASGNGKVMAAPDTAVVNIGVETRGADPKIAVEQNNQEMTKLVTGLKALAIADADLQTSNFNIRFERIEHWPPVATAPAAPVGKAVAVAEAPKPERPAVDGVFVVTNTLSVTVRDLTKLGDALSSSTAAGANTIWGVDFRINDPEPLLAQARDKAVAEALEKAKRLAAAAGVKVGPLLSIEESGRGGPMPVGAMFSTREAKSSVPIEAGSMEVSADVVVRFALQPAN